MDLLFYLVQKEEIDISAITLKRLTEQFIQAIDNAQDVDLSSEILSLVASLLVLKSQKLLPEKESFLESVEDPRIEFLQSLIEYCQIKGVAKNLGIREETQKGFFPRAASCFKKDLNAGLEEVELKDLKSIFLEVLKRIPLDQKNTIQEEQWQVADKLNWLKEYVYLEKKIALSILFAHTEDRTELIVIFLALLEMMKLNQANIIIENETYYITQANHVPRN